MRYRLLFCNLSNSCFLNLVFSSITNVKHGSFRKMGRKLNTKIHTFQNGQINAIFVGSIQFVVITQKLIFFLLSQLVNISRLESILLTKNNRKKVDTVQEILTLLDCIILKQKVLCILGVKSKLDRVGGNQSNWCVRQYTLQLFPSEELMNSCIQKCFSGQIHNFSQDP